MYMCACVCAQEGQKGVGSLYLENQAVVSCLMQALKLNVMSSTRTIRTLKHGAISPAPRVYIF